jgi:hypothetical protein
MVLFFLYPFVLPPHRQRDSMSTLDRLLRFAHDAGATSGATVAFSIPSLVALVFLHVLRLRFPASAVSCPTLPSRLCMFSFPLFLHTRTPLALAPLRPCPSCHFPVRTPLSHSS